MIDSLCNQKKVLTYNSNEIFQCQYQQIFYFIYLLNKKQTKKGNTNEPKKIIISLISQTKLFLTHIKKAYIMEIIV